MAYTDDLCLSEFKVGVKSCKNIQTIFEFLFLLKNSGYYFVQSLFRIVFVVTSSARTVG